MNTTRIAALTLSALLLSGCASVRSQKLEKSPSYLRKGSTTKEQVVILLGEPNWKSFEPGGEIWVYGDRPTNATGNFVVNEAVGVGSSFIPVPFAGTAVRAILFAGKKSTRKGRTQATVEFDRRGIVSDYAVQVPS